MFRAIHKHKRYQISLVNVYGKAGIVAFFDTGAVSTIISVESLAGEDIDKEKLASELRKTGKEQVFYSASGNEMHGYLVCAPDVSISGMKIKQFYYYLIVDVDDNLALLGNDFISYCNFTHKQEDDIMVSSFDYEKYCLHYEAKGRCGNINEILELSIKK